MSRAALITARLYARPVQRTLYFGSATQNLKSPLLPRLPQTAHSDYTKKTQTLYASDDRAYAAVFTFDWHEEDGFSFGKSGKRGRYILTIPYRFLIRLEASCSLYVVDGYFSRLPIATPEFITHDPVTIIREEKYPTVDECLRHNGVIVKVTRVKHDKDITKIHRRRERVIKVRELP